MNGTKLQKVIFLTWSILWFLALLPFGLLHRILEVLFIRFWDALIGLDFRYIIARDIQPYDWYSRLPLIAIGLIFPLWLISTAIAIKFSPVLKCSGWLWRLAWIAAMFLAFCCVRSEILIRSTPWEAIWHWIATLAIMVPFWLLGPTKSNSFCNPRQTAATERDQTSDVR